LSRNVAARDHLDDNVGIGIDSDNDDNDNQIDIDYGRLALQAGNSESHNHTPRKEGHGEGECAGENDRNASDDASLLPAYSSECESVASSLADERADLAAHIGASEMRRRKRTTRARQRQRRALIEAESQHAKDDDDTDDAEEEDEINCDKSEQTQECARVEPKRGDEQTTGESIGELVLSADVDKQSMAETDEVALGRSVADACVALRSRTDGLERKRVVLSRHMSSLLDFAQKESSLDVQPVLDAISSQIRTDEEYVEQRIQPLLTRLKETLTDILSL
jgi:hypothetical protein